MSTENFTKRKNPTEEIELDKRLQQYRNYKMLLLSSHFNLITIAEFGCGGGAELNYKTTKADHRSKIRFLFGLAAVFLLPAHRSK